MSHRPQTVGGVAVPESLVGAVRCAVPSPPILAFADQRNRQVPSVYWSGVNFDASQIFEPLFRDDAFPTGGVTRAKGTLHLGAENTAWRHNGIDGRLIVPEAAELNPFSSDWAWELWFEADVPTGSGCLFCKADAAGANGIAIYLDPPGTVSVVVHNTISVQMAGEYMDGRPHHVIVNLDRVNKFLWLVVDGVMSAQTDATALGAVSLQSTANLAIGCEYFGNAAGTFFNGLLDDVALYDHVIPLNEAVLQYQAGITPATGMVGRAPLARNENSSQNGYVAPPGNGPIAPRASGFAVAMTAVQSTTFATNSILLLSTISNSGSGVRLTAGTNFLAWGEFSSANSNTVMVMSRAMTAGTIWRVLVNHTTSWTTGYINGTTVGTMANLTWVSQNTATIGVWQGAHSATGWRDLVIFDRPLTTAEVALVIGAIP
jgi:hypothetical protein